MNPYDLTRLVIVLVILLVTGIFLLIKFIHPKNKITIKTIARAAIFGGLAAILYIVPFFQVKLPIFPMFLEIHFDEIPLFVAGFAYGPIVAIFATIVKTLIKLPMTTTLCVGELTDFLYSLVFILPAVFIYKHHRNVKGALVGLLVGSGIQMVVASFFTTFVVLNFYMFVMGLSKEAILDMVKSVNPMVTSLDWPFLSMIVLPFNAIKDSIVIVLTFLIYKTLHRLIDKIVEKTSG